MRPPSIPFQVIALAPFRHGEEKTWRHDPIRVEKTNIDQVMAELGVSLYIPLPENLCRLDGLELAFGKIRDFHPDTMAEKNLSLGKLLEARQFVNEAKIEGLSAESIYNRLKDWPGFPMDVTFDPSEPKPPTPGPIDDILKMVEVPGEISISPGDTGSFTDQIDRTLNRIVGHIFSSEDFRRLESTWRGLKFLLSRGEFNGDKVLKIIPVSSGSLEETLGSLLPRMIQDLPSLVIIDLPFDSSEPRLSLLEKVAAFSENLMAPSLIWITAGFLSIDSWEDLSRLPFLPHHMEEHRFARWRKFKETPSARWIAATCNRFLSRYPYGPDNKTKNVHLTESQDGPWMSPVWALGSLIGQSLAKTGWPTRFTAWKDMRLLDLPLTTAGGTRNLATEANFSDDRIDQFIRSGIIPLVAPFNKDLAFMPVETTAAGGSLAHQLFLSRISHLIFWCRENLGEDLDPDNIEQGLTKAFSLFFEKTGHTAPENLEISVGKPEPDQPATAKIIIDPPKQILPSGEKIELELRW
jgi:type VI secretion system protein ImpC